MSNWTDITEQSRQTDPIGTVEFLVKKFGKWTLGYKWVDVSLGKAATTGLFLYCEKDGREANKRCVFSLKEAIGFFADRDAPAKAVSVVLNRAEATGRFPL